MPSDHHVPSKTVGRGSREDSAATDLRDWRLFSEYAFRQRVPLFGTIELTKHCNLRCRHCYLTVDARRSRKSMALHVFDELLGSLEQSGCVSVTLTGGEVLAFRGFGRFYRNACERGFMVNLQTNATLFLQKAIGLFRELPPSQMSVSIYGGTEKTYEAVAGVRGSYRILRESLDHVAELGVRLSFRATIMKRNVDEYEAMRAIALHYGGEFSPYFYLGPAADQSGYSSQQRLDPEELACLEFEDPPTVQKFLNLQRGFCSGLLSTKNAFNCRAGMTSFFVSAEARLQLCAHLVTPTFDLTRKSFRDLWREEVLSTRNWHRAFAKEDPKGEAYAFLCPQCPARSLAWTGQRDKPVEYLQAVFRARVRQWKARGMDERLKDEAQ